MNKDLGRVSVILKGEYDPDVQYERLDCVSYQGSSYLVRKPCRGVTPAEGEYYMLCAQAGDGFAELKGAVITATGDSITAQERNFAKLIAEAYGMVYENVARGGGTVAAGILDLDGGHRPSICDTIASMRQDADIILLSGGVNDQVGLNHSLEFLGELTDGFDQTLNKATLYGALEYMLRQAVYKWNNKTILYVLPHRMTKNLDYRTAVLRACEKYGVPVVDIMESTMDFYTLPEFKALYTDNADGWHPNEEGFRVFYVPRILAAIRKHFRGKGDTVTLDDANMPDVICVNSGSSPSETFTPDIPGFIRTTNGSISTSANYLRTDYLPLAGKVSMEYNVFVAGGSESNHSTWALFDENKNWIVSSDDCTKQDFWHKGPNGNDLMVGFKHNEIAVSELLASYPTAAYVIFSTYVNPEYEMIVDDTEMDIGWGTQEVYILLKGTAVEEEPTVTLSPVAWTEDMTLPVGMDAQGRLFAQKDPETAQLTGEMLQIRETVGEIKLEAISPENLFPAFTAYSDYGITVNTEENRVVMENVTNSGLILLPLCSTTLSPGTYTFGIIGTLIDKVYLQALYTPSGGRLTFLVESKSASTAFILSETATVTFRLYVAAGTHNGETAFYLSRGDTSKEIYDGKKSVADTYARDRIKEINGKNRLQDLLVDVLYKGSGNVLLLGDSITHGVGSSDFSNTGEAVGVINDNEVKRNVGSKSWAAKFSDHLSENYGMTVTNNGVSGIGISGVTNNLTILAPDAAYAAIIVMVGVNSRNQGKTEIVNAYRTLIDALKPKTEALIFLSAIPDNGASGITMPAMMNLCLRKACVETGTAYANLYSAFCREIGTSKSEFYEDTLHPNDNGYEKIYECVIQLLGV